MERFPREEVPGIDRVVNPPEAIAVRTVASLLESWLGPPVEVEAGTNGRRLHADAILRAGDATLLVEVKGSDEFARISAAVEQLRTIAADMPAAIIVLVVPFMGPKAREYVRSRGVSWIDLSGNADVQGPGVRILVEGKPNRFASRGRPSTAFSPRSARVSRALLVEPERSWLQRDLSYATGLGTGTISKVVGRLIEDGLVTRRVEDGRLRAPSPSTLLDAWAQEYDFARHHVERFHTVGRSGREVLDALASKLRALDTPWAATGLAAAWQLAEYADFRLTTIYMAAPLRDPGSLGLRPVEHGENVWIVVPNDEGVFYAAEEVGWVRCVHPVQAYLDLLGHPERSKEAADNLRARKLGWGD